MTTTEFPSAAARAAAAAALVEDASGKDITTVWSVPEDLAATAEIRTRQSGIAAGLPVVAEVFAQVDPEVKVEPAVADGARLADGQVLVHLSGSARSLITGERTALNFLQRMCGIATLTDRYVQAVAGPGRASWTRARRRRACAPWTSMRSPPAAATTTASISRRWSCSRRTTSPQRAG